MAIHGKLRWGLIGGGEGSQIGSAHRIGATLDGRFELVAAAMDIDPDRGREFALRQGVGAARAHGGLARDAAARGRAGVRGAARPRHGRDAERDALPDREGVPGGRFRRPVREAAHHHRRGGRGSRADGARGRPHPGGELRLQRLPDGAAGARDGARRRAGPHSRGGGGVRARVARRRVRRRQPARALALRPGAGRGELGAGGHRTARAPHGVLRHRPGRAPGVRRLRLDRRGAGARGRRLRGAAVRRGGRRGACGRARWRSGSSTA